MVRNGNRARTTPRDTWLGLLLLTVIVLAYSPALTGGYVWDDDAHVTRTALRSWDGLRSIWFNLHATQQYYPLLHSAFWLEADRKSTRLNFSHLRLSRMPSSA